MFKKINFILFDEKGEGALSGSMSLKKARDFTHDSLKEFINNSIHAPRQGHTGVYWVENMSVSVLVKGQGIT